MNGENKISYQEAIIEKLNGENKDLRAELEVCKREIDSKKTMLTQTEKMFGDLKKQYEQYLFWYSERVEELTEAKLEYERAAAELRALMDKYKAEAKRNIERIRRAV